MFSVQPYQNHNKDIWNEMVMQSYNATFLHNRDFMDYHANRFKDGSLLVYKKEKLFGILPANRVGETLHSHQGLTYGGFIYKASSKFKDILDAFRAVLKYLEGNSVEILKLKALPNIYTITPNDIIDYLNFLVKGNMYRKDLISVVKPSEKRFSNSRKEGFKRGLKHQLIVEEVNDFNAFWNEILIPNLKEKHGVLPVHSLEEISLLKERFPKNIRQFNVYASSKIIAGATIFETEQVAHVQYISGNSDKNELGSLDYLHIYLIEKVFKDKPYFDFGMSHTNEGKINEGLHFWKEGFGAYAVIQNFYKIETKNHTFLDNLFI